MLSRICLLGIIWLWALATITGAANFKCETTDGSPKASDCQQALDDITHPERVKGKIPKCFPTNSKGSGCKEVFWHGTCSITLCRKDGALDLTVAKEAVQMGAHLLHDTCKKGDKVGGYISFDSMGWLNNGSSCSPKEGNSVDRPVNIEFVKR